MLNVPNEVLERWAQKANAMQESGNLSLPYASTVGLAMGGQIHDEELLMSLQKVVDRYPDEMPLDAGAAKCKTLDREFVDAYSGPYRGTRSAESCWVATDESFMYIMPRLGAHRRWPWGSVQTIEPRKQGRRSSKFVLADKATTFELSTGTTAMANLLSIYSWIESR